MDLQWIKRRAATRRKPNLNVTFIHVDTMQKNLTQIATKLT